MTDQRDAMFERWERAAAGWKKRAQEVREHGMPVSIWMVEHLGLQPGERVLELAAGPGDTGFLAAELIRPGGVLISSDGAEAMLATARERAERFGIDNVEFKRLELEWIDLETASIDAVLCRWGVMLSVDPAAVLHEVRRVLRPGGRFTLAVWDQAERNPWATIPGRTMIELGHSEPPDPNAPGMFTLAAPGRLQEMLEAAGFVEVLVDSVDQTRRYDGLDAYLAETLDLSMLFAEAYNGLEADEQREVREKIAALAEPYSGSDGSLTLPGSSLVALANA
jgi:SAM-dependent methyltransferase